MPPELLRRGSYQGIWRAFPSRNRRTVETRRGVRSWLFDTRQEGQTKGPNMSTVPVMQIRHTETGEWLVAAKWPDGTVEDIRGFATETDANEWIAHELQSWLDGRKADERSHA
jgi:hypothetical protein